MPSEIAQTIVNHIFGDEKAKAVDAMNDALSASAYDAIQQHKVEFAKTHGFNPDDTAQAVADEITDNQDPAGDIQNVDYQGRKPDDAPEGEVEQPEASAEVEPTDEPTVEEEPNDETNS